MKRIIVLLTALLIPLLAACTTRITEHNVNYLEIYGDFLSYSLGDFALLSEEVDRRISPGGVEEFKAWTVQFVHQNGEEMQFQFGNALSMRYYVARHAERFGVSVLSREFGLANNPNVFLQMRFQHDVPREYRDYSRLVAPQSGLRLYSMTPQELVEYWGFALSVSVHNQESEQGAEALELEHAKELVRELADYIQHDEVSLSFVISAYDSDEDRERAGELRMKLEDYTLWDDINLGDISLELHALQPSRTTIHLVYCRQSDTFKSN